MAARQPFVYHGKLRKDRKTKLLVQRLRPGEIALVEHQDMDRLSADSLLRCGTRVVLNTRSFSSGLIPPEALQELLQHGVHLVENLGDDFFKRVREGERVTVCGGKVLINKQVVARGEVVTPEMYHQRRREALLAQGALVDSFIMNTLHYAYRERRLVTGDLPLPKLQIPVAGRDAVVVIRGKGYREDLKALRNYIRDKKPVLVGVDGGADALREFGFRPDLVIGDMDSVGDRALREARERVVHEYADGRGAPGRERLERLGLPYKLFSAPGTSEDIALLLLYELGAELIVAIGTHTSVVEFLEKGRRGMSSTFLVRLKVGDCLLDAKGVSRLYRARPPRSFIPMVVAAGLVPLLALITFSPQVQHLIRLVLYRFMLSP